MEKVALRAACESLVASEVTAAHAEHSIHGGLLLAAF